MLGLRGVSPLERGGAERCPRGSGIAGEVCGAHSAAAVAGWRLEHLRGRSERDQCDGEGVFCAEAGGAFADAALYAGGARVGAAAGWHSADEHLLETLPGAAGTVSVGLSPDGAAGDGSFSALVLFQRLRALVVES